MTDRNNTERFLGLLQLARGEAAASLEMDASRRAAVEGWRVGELERQMVLLDSYEFEAREKGGGEPLDPIACVPDGLRAYLSDRIDERAQRRLEPFEVPLSEGEILDAVLGAAELVARLRRVAEADPMVWRRVGMVIREATGRLDEVEQLQGAPGGLLAMLRAMLVEVLPL